MNIARILSTELEQNHDRTAIIDPHRGRRRETTFAALDQWANEVQASLLETGLRPGDSILVFQPMSAELYAMLLAIFRAGMVAMFIDPAHGRRYIERCCQLCPPQGMIATPKAHLLRFVSPALRRIPHKFSTTYRLPLTKSFGGRLMRSSTSITPVAEETPALITFTSGSTGQPKAALRTHGFLYAQHQTISAHVGMNPALLSLATMPIVTLTNLASGVPSLIPNVDLRYPGRVDAAILVAQIQAEQVGSGVASPALWERVVAHCEAAQMVLPQLKSLYTGGAPVFPRLLDRLQKIAPNAQVHAVYGSTEAEPIAKLCYAKAVAVDERDCDIISGLLVGKPVPEIELRIMKPRWGTPVGALSDESFQAISCGPEEAGEIVVSGNHVLGGYLNGMGDEETKFTVDGTLWHRTGDMGRLDQLGQLWLLGRCVACTEDERGILYPLAVESALQENPAVRRSAVIQHKGKRLALLEMENGVYPAELEPILEQAQIDEVRVCKQIPVDKRHNAKIDYAALASI